MSTDEMLDSANLVSPLRASSCCCMALGKSPKHSVTNADLQSSSSWEAALLSILQDRGYLLHDDANVEAENEVFE